MKIISTLEDKKINGLNISFELKADQYVNISKNILDNNEYQRRKVKNSGTVYSLLKNDIISGCVIPPIVLASSQKIPIKDYDLINEQYINDNLLSKTDKLLILDGLQRTYLLIEIENDENIKKSLETLVLRIELYININEVGILYRMLTLNTGQTPMALRHQIEILYSNYLDSNIGDIQLIKQIDEKSKSNINQYNFSDIVEGYNSYLERSELPLDRFSLLDIVKSLENLSKENLKKELFQDFIITYHKFISTIQATSKGWTYPEDESVIAPEYKIAGEPFGKVSFKIFNKSQAITGFGSAIGKLIDNKIISNFDEIKSLIEKVEIKEIDVSFLSLIKRLDTIRKESKKIGNAQRLFFHHFFRGLFDKGNDTFLKFFNAIDYGYKRYKSEMD